MNQPPKSIWISIEVKDNDKQFLPLHFKKVVPNPPDGFLCTVQPAQGGSKLGLLR